MAQKIKAFEDNDIWSLVPLLEGKYCIGC